MTWKAYYETATGRLLSVGEIEPEQLPPGVSELLLAGQPNIDAVMWDVATRAFVARPAKVLVDRLQDMITDSAYSADLIALWNALNATNRTRLRNGLIRLLGGARWRGPAQPITIEPGG